VNRRIYTYYKLQPSVSTSFARQQTNNLSKCPLRVLAQTKLDVGLLQVFPRVFVGTFYL
jgi:hypothetical protein